MRKKKETRKYKPKNEFRKNHSPLAEGHVNYVFGETKNKYKSMGLTHAKSSTFKQVELTKNPNPKDETKAYLEPHVQTANKKYYGSPLNDWAFSKEDKPMVRHYIKQYKKSISQKKKGNKKR